MKIIALIPKELYSFYLRNTAWLEIALKDGIIYSLSEWERIGTPQENYESRTLTVDSEFNVITPQ